MGNIHNLKVIRQCFSYLSEEDFTFPISDHRVQRLTTLKCCKLLMASQLANWGSLRQISRELRTSDVLQESLELSSISASQISRRLNLLPTEVLETLFLDRIAEVKSLIPSVPSKVGPIRIIDSTSLKLPKNLASWAYVTQDSTRIKIHVRVLTLPKGGVIPEKAIPSTGNVSDYATMDTLVEDDGTIYVMDRGYVKYAQFDKWLVGNVRFVTRINENHRPLHVEEELPVRANTNITRDAIVRLGSTSAQTENLIRIVEFVDETGRKYRVASSCFDITAEEIADIYHQRWLIELFFKWMKQHLRLVKLYSYEPQGIWNQIFIALIAYAISMLIQIQSGTRLSQWDVLQCIRACWYKSWEIFEMELHPQTRRTSRGRQKIPDAPKADISGKGMRIKTTVGILRPSKAGVKNKTK